MNSRQPNPVVAAAAARNRGRVRLRTVTAMIGAAGLAMAGVVTCALPGSSHTSTASGTTSTGSTSSGSGVSSAQGGGQTTSGAS